MRRTGPTPTTRDQVFARDRSCVMCGDTFALQVHHRRPRAAGGTRRPETNGPANLVLLCHAHHAWVESHRDLARQRGFLVPQHAEPADVALIHHGVWVWLADDFSVTPLGASDLAEQGVTDQTLLGEQDGAAAVGRRSGYTPTRIATRTAQPAQPVGTGREDWPCPTWQRLQDVRAGLDPHTHIWNNGDPCRCGLRFGYKDVAS